MKELTFEEMLMINGGRRGDHGDNGFGGSSRDRDRQRDLDRFSKGVDVAANAARVAEAAGVKGAGVVAGGLEKLGDYIRDPHVVGGGDYDSGRLH